jgi:putative oxidoreductase
MIRRLFKADGTIAGTALRIFLGMVMLPHGAQKLLGWFGGAGFTATMRGFESHFHIPTVFALLAILAESVGAVALIAGFFTRVAALALSVDMLVAVALGHLKNGFFMNWSGTAKGEGFEYHILAVAIGVALMIMGGGRWSLDGVIAKKLKR